MIKGLIFEEMEQNFSVFYKVLGFLTLLEVVEKMIKMFWLKLQGYSFMKKKSVRVYFSCYFKGHFSKFRIWAAPPPRAFDTINKQLGALL